MISLGHGSGGKLTWDLINKISKKFESVQLTDSALLANKIAFTTDSFVVHPLFFSGGDIGKLSVCGTINDLSVMGAKPLYLSCALIIEEGFEEEKLQSIIDSMAKTAKEAEVKVVTGDTKVVEKGKADGIFINTSGIGSLTSYEPKKIEEGDEIIINGEIGQHAIAIMTSRFDLDFEIESDCAPLNGLISSLPLDEVKFMRDPTRGGIAATLNEAVEDVGIEIYEEKIPVSEEVRAVCELLGFDPLYLANEGKVIVIARDGEEIVRAMRKHPLGQKAKIIGKVTEDKGRVFLRSLSGGRRIVDMPVADQLPRIC
ncbi:MAG: hydrogenase expression/formation protein HypE [Candidatus Thermoplasmatota archaeon]|nr:hydrogenase expression/formation protein HypE [Candidatus Thermoplasmatota archaeon]